MVKGLAIRLARGDVVAPIRGKRIVELPMHELARATPSRSQLVHNLQQAIEEASRNPTIILFIDEMHTVVGTGSAVGDLDIASLLKPALGKATGCIGATTVENYRRYMEPDPFFERHCQAIVVNEPSLHEMKEILAQVRPRYEEHHMVTITPEALEAAVELCAKYMPDKHFPKRLLTCLIRRVHGRVLARSPSWRPSPPQKRCTKSRVKRWRRRWRRKPASLWYVCSDHYGINCSASPRKRPRYSQRYYRTPDGIDLAERPVIDPQAACDVRAVVLNHYVRFGAICQAIR